MPILAEPRECLEPMYDVCPCPPSTSLSIASLLYLAHQRGRMHHDALHVRRDIALMDNQTQRFIARERSTEAIAQSHIAFAVEAVRCGRTGGMIDTVGIITRFEVW